MKLLLDTNALIWAIEDNPRLGRKARGLIADSNHEILFSVVSIWEAVLKVRAGKVQFDWRKLAGAAGANGFRRIDLSIGHVTAFETLEAHHRDPFDHMILAQAISEGATLVTSDAMMMKYDVPIVECG